MREDVEKEWEEYFKQAGFIDNRSIANKLIAIEEFQEQAIKDMDGQLVRNILILVKHEAITLTEAEEQLKEIIENCKPTEKEKLINQD